MELEMDSNLPVGKMYSTPTTGTYVLKLNSHT